jgi:cell division protein FtsZ
MMPMPAMPTIPTMPPHQTAEAIEHAAKAAVAAAVLPMVEDVTIRPIPPKPSLFPEQLAPRPEPPPAPRNFIPPPPERMANRPRRMPGLDELPRPAQAELRVKRGEQPEPEHPGKQRVGLLRRLAAVGLGRREEDEGPEVVPANVRQGRPANPSMAPPMAPSMAPPAPPRPAERMPAPPPRPTMPIPRAPDPVSEYARRPSHQGLDPLGRQAPVHNSVEEDQLDIPAFLRRQAN